MINAINGINFSVKKTNSTNAMNAQATAIRSANNTNFSTAASNALKLNSLNFARSVKFTGALHGAFSDLNESMQTCKTKDHKGESVGSRANINKLLHDFAGEFSLPNDAIKTTVKTGEKEINNKKVPIYARTQIKSLDLNDDGRLLRFEMAVRKPSFDIMGEDVKNEDYSQVIRVDMKPIDYRGKGTHEQAYVLNTKGSLMAVVEDESGVILTNSGTLSKLDNDGMLNITAESKGNVFKPFNAVVPEVVERKLTPSIGEGTEIVIGMENGRFVNEIKDSIQEFVKKVENKEIILPQFKAAPNAKNTQLIMLAGGFGSRAEYTNASSSAIFHDIEGGSQSTKGVFRTATGLTPMETTFVTLHKAGLLDCSKGNLGIGKNIKFYLNKGQNRGNGEFSADLYNKMDREDRKAAIIFPNDSMSRMTNAVIEANELISSGKAAIAMIAKKVPQQECIKTFGIIKYNPETRVIEGFAEKPAEIPAGYADEDGMCVTNTFQFGVSDEAFKVLDMFEDYFIFKEGEKESRDWSKQYVPILQTLTEETDYNVIRKQLAKSLGNKPENIPDSLIEEAQTILGDQKLYVVPTDEPWADCGTLNALYDTTIKIAKGEFPLEDFEQANAISCINTRTGLIASSANQKAKIESKYNVFGKVMVVPEAKKVDAASVADIEVVENLD